MKKVYVALSLTHVKTEEEKEEIRQFLKWLVITFEVELLMWAFDTDTWTPKPVENIYRFDSTQVLAADLVIALYLSSDGSDGRGGEVVQRVMRGQPILALAREGIRMSRYPIDCLKTANVDVFRFKHFKETENVIRAALARI